MNEDLLKVINSPIVRDLSDKLSTDVTKAAAHVAALTDTDMQQAFIIIHAASTLVGLGAYILGRNSKLPGDKAYELVRQFLDLRMDSTVQELEERLSQGVGPQEAVYKLLRGMMK